ncbi:hypothetical protein DFH07DRAFT_915330 [Mycena maculata]|uniref:Uncharacterized protein n=1 Tax=Mycena maculata TaxID=230809 RepID=A0AAD7JQZ8_9AGAR|nr:hypothetical protein DFH07DRAFT_915330 [Mycena maculata]
MELSPTIRKLLCQSWHWDSDECHMITFNADGSGEIISRAELNLWIAAFTQWKLLDIISDDTQALATPLPEPTFIGRMLSTASHTVVLKARVEITLSRNRMTTLYGRDITRRRINDDVLLDEAFQTKQYTITVGRGQFATQHAIKNKHPKQPLYALQMAFDRSPLPAKSEWKPDQQAMVESVRQYEMTNFCTQELGRTADSGGCITM